MCKVDSGRVGGVNSKYQISNRSLTVDECQILRKTESSAIQNRRNSRMQVADWVYSECFAEKMLPKVPDVKMRHLNEGRQLAKTFDTKASC